MRAKLIILMTLLPMLITLNTESKVTSWEKISDIEIQELLQSIELNSRLNNFNYLSKAKLFLINGDTDKALYFLQKIDEDSNLNNISKRYEAIIYFIINRFDKTRDILNDTLFNSLTNYPQICLLKVINFMFLSEKKNMSKEFAQCQSSANRYSQNNLLWTESLVRLKAEKESALNGQDIIQLENILDDNELIRPWLKLGIYTNKEYLIKKYISRIDGTLYKSHTIRELLSLIYYRLGEDNLALSFIEDIYSPNAENIKGNIMLKKKQFELAFGHFKVALKRKENSMNALERAIPLAWTLGQWKDGLQLLSKIINQNLDIRKKLSLNTMLQIKLKNYSRSMQQLNTLNDLYQMNLPKELSIMKSYVAAITNDNKELKKYSNRSCNKKDGFNCWLSIQQYIWEDISKTIQRDEKTTDNNLFTLEILKQKSNDPKINELIIIDQKDIEELDSELVQLR